MSIGDGPEVRGTGGGAWAAASGPHPVKAHKQSSAHRGAFFLPVGCDALRQMALRSEVTSADY